MDYRQQLRSSFSAWIRLFRLPNLLTVPGDALAGFALGAAAGSGAIPADLLAAILAGLFFYAAGLVVNDLVDQEEDRRERPGRPLASGAIGKTAAMNVAGVLLGLALLMLGIRGSAPLLTGIVLGGLIFLYNLYARRSRLAGALVMGLCRAGSVGLGMVAANPSGWQSVESIAVLVWWTVYVAAVSWLASREMSKGAYGRERYLPVWIVVAGGWFMLLYSEQSNSQSLFRAVFSLAFAVLITYQSALRLGMPLRWQTASGRIQEAEAGRLYPPVIGSLISALLPMQVAVLILMSNEPWMLLAALILLLFWPINRWLARAVPAS